jgi:uncharacterized protein YbaR (Trm112 family)
VLRSIRTLVSELARIPAERRRHSPQPPASGLVVEVGAGQSPHPRTDLVVDKYVADDYERAGEAALDFSKPLVVGDGHRLPLRDRAAAYVIAIHVLEHATDPGAFAGELARIAPAGFVQVPSREAELTFSWPYHPWLIDLRGGRLVFAPRGDAVAPVGDFHHLAHAESVLVRLAFAARRSGWHHSLEWREGLPVEVLGESAAIRAASFDLEATVAVLERVRVPPLTPELRAALACPVCRGPLSVDAAAANCRMCGRDYPVANNVPVLLPEPSARTPR